MSNFTSTFHSFNDLASRRVARLIQSTVHRETALRDLAYSLEDDAARICLQMAARRAEFEHDLEEELTSLQNSREARTLRVSRHSGSMRHEDFAEIRNDVRRCALLEIMGGQECEELFLVALPDSLSDLLAHHLLEIQVSLNTLRELDASMVPRESSACAPLCFG